MQWREFLEKSMPARLDQEVWIEGTTADGYFFRARVNGLMFGSDEVTITTDQEGS